MTGAQEVVIDNGIGKVEGIGGLGVTPAATTTYVLTATGSGGSARAAVKIDDVKPKPCHCSVDGAVGAKTCSRYVNASAYADAPKGVCSSRATVV